MKFTIAIGNPPYGVGGNLAIKFINKTSEISDDVRFVLPTSVRKPSSLNKIKAHLHCVVDEDLDPSTFPNGISAVKQYWEVKNTSRFQIGVGEIPMMKEHPDFEFLPYEQRFDDIDSTIELFSQFGEAEEGFSVVARKKAFIGDLEAQELAFRDEVIDDTIDKKILDTIAKNKRIIPSDIAKVLDIEEDEVQSRINKLVALEILEYDVDTQVSKLLKPLNEILDKPLKTSFLVRYEYSWDYLRTTQKDRNMNTSRPFCQRLMSLKKLYTRGEIEQISARLGYDVFARAGGWWTLPDTNIHSPKCRHTWNAVVVVKK